MSTGASNTDVLVPIAGYLECVESGDAEGLRAFFTDDAVGNWGADGEIALNGIEQIVEFFARPRDLVSLTFLAGPAQVTIDGDRATSRSKSIAFVDAGDAKITIACTDYTDRLRREGDAWKIEHRHHVTIWSAEAPLVARAVAQGESHD